MTDETERDRTEVVKVTIEYYTTTSKWDEQWAQGVLDDAAKRVGAQLAFHCCLTESLDDDPIKCPDCLTRLEDIA